MNDKRKGTDRIELGQGDDLLVVDVQNDFLPGGSLAVAEGNFVIPVLNAYIGQFTERGLPVFSSRDWHPLNHCSFIRQGGPWPEQSMQMTCTGSARY